MVMSPVHLERWAGAGIFLAGYKFSAIEIEEKNVGGGRG